MAYQNSFKLICTFLLTSAVAKFSFPSYSSNSKFNGPIPFLGNYAYVVNIINRKIETILTFELISFNESLLTTFPEGKSNNLKFKLSDPSLSLSP